MVSSSFVEHAVLGFAFAILTLFVLAVALIAVVLLTVTHSCWWKCDVERAQLLDDYGNYFAEFEAEPVQSVIGKTPKGADLV